jgi:MerR family transcriptional regulator, light-induced transcriptional regulator
MSGVSEGLIRAWERRYGVLKPKRTPSGYRAYTDGDIEILKRLKKLTEEGVSIAEAVKLLPRIRREVKDAETAAEAVPKRSPKGEQLDAWRREVIAAAERLDQQAVEVVLDEAMNSLPPVVFFGEVLAPLQREVGERWHAGTMTIAEEHLVTQAARQRVMTLLHQAPRRAKKHVVCACYPTEDHELGLMGAALRFRHAGWRVTFMGARTPVEHLARVVNAVKPDVVALSCINDGGEGAVFQVTEAIVSAIPTSSVVIGGLAISRHAAALSKLPVVLALNEATWNSLLE